MLKDFVKNPWVSEINKLIIPWLQIMAHNLPREQQEKIESILEQSNPKEVRTLLSNIEEGNKKRDALLEKTGAEKKAIEIAKSLLDVEGLTIEVIAEKTGLSVDQVKKLREEKNNN